MELLQRGGPKHDLKPAEETWESLALFFFADEQQCRDEVDALAMHFAKTGKAPATVSARARYYFSYRIQCANDFLGMLFPPQANAAPFGEVPKSFTDAQLIEWLLIDLWVRRHDHWLKLNAIGLYGPFSFYGVGPADPQHPQ